MRSPVAGCVLRVIQESEATVAAGTPIIEIGDPDNLEIRVDLLSEEAVRVQPGQRASIENWGGEGTLRGIVRRIEPYGYTKVSALGIEEQRVNVVIGLVDSPEKVVLAGRGIVLNRGLNQVLKRIDHCRRGVWILLAQYLVLQLRIDPIPTDPLSIIPDPI